MSSTGVRFSRGKLINLFSCSATGCERRDKDRGKKRRNESEKEQRGDFVELRGQPGEKVQKKRRSIKETPREETGTDRGTKKRRVRVYRVRFASL